MKFSKNHKISFKLFRIELKQYFLITLLLLGLQVRSQNLTSVLVSSGFSSPTDIANAGDERLFIVERGGAIWILDGMGNRLPAPFLDVDDRSSSGGERGLLGLAFHPDYQNNGYFYVNYTNNEGDTRISRFTVTADRNIADPNSEMILMEVEQPFANHNAGDLEFSPLDGYLYFGLGDGGSANDPLRSGQDRLSLLGKMIRIDVDNGDPYTIPEDNPYAEDDFTLDEIWALGLRNPWRFSFDRETGDMYIADVGQNVWEEINFQPADSDGGENYGWRCYEANTLFRDDAECPDMSQLTFPVYAYAHSGSNGCSVTGGFVYRGSSLPDYDGRYLYGDYCSGKIWQLFRDGTDWVNEEVLDVEDFQLSTFGEDNEGEMYYALIGAGQIYRLADFCEVNPLTAPEITVDQNTLSVPAIYETYRWFDDQLNLLFFGSNEFMPEESGSYYVEVTDENGCRANSEPVEVTISSTSEPKLEGLKIWPTLFNTHINIQLPGSASGQFTLEVYDLNGRLIFQQQGISGNQKVNLNDVSSGMYFLKLMQDGVYVHSERLIKS